jgi:hypothetical protein
MVLLYRGLPYLRSRDLYSIHMPNRWNFAWDYAMFIQVRRGMRTHRRRQRKQDFFQPLVNGCLVVSLISKVHRCTCQNLKTRQRFRHVRTSAEPLHIFTCLFPSVII